MKKIIACISLVFAMSAGVTALAATTAEPTTNETNNTVSVTSDATYNTVLIQKLDNSGNPTETVYVNQKDDGYLTTATNLLLKSDAGYGDYKITTNNTAGNAKSESTFSIVNPNQPKEDKALEEVVIYTGTNHKDLGFKITDELDGYDKLVITGTPNGGEPKSIVATFTAITGGSDVSIALRVNQVPLNATVTVSVAASN